jgi:hypothetical protein
MCLSISPLNLRLWSLCFPVFTNKTSKNPWQLFELKPNGFQGLLALFLNFPWSFPNKWLKEWTKALSCQWSRSNNQSSSKAYDYHHATKMSLNRNIPHRNNGRNEFKFRKFPLAVERPPISCDFCCQIFIFLVREWCNCVWWSQYFLNCLWL